LRCGVGSVAVVTAITNPRIRKRQPWHYLSRSSHLGKERLIMVEFCMSRSVSKKNDAELENEQLWKRYARQIMLPELGEHGQRQLQAARVLIVGVGGLGSAVSLYLAAPGSARSGLVMQTSWR